MSRARIVISSVAAALALGACAVGPNFHRPAAPAVTAYVGGDVPAGSDAQRFLTDRPVSANWWTEFGSADLNALVSEALRANPSIAAAQAALSAARETYKAQLGAFLPTATASAGASRNRNAVQVLAPTLTSGAELFNLYSASVNVGYTLDIFGANRRQAELLNAVAESARYQLDATYLTVAGNVVVAAVQEAGFSSQVSTTARAVQLARDNLAIMQKQFALGAIARLDVAAQEAALAGLEGSLAPLKRQLEVTRHLLAVLLGRLPADGPIAQLHLDSLQLPAEVPLDVPSELVNRRPDVRAAEAMLHAATAADGVAIADLLPQLTLAGTVGSSSTAIAQLLKSGTGFWSIGANLSQTLFAGEALLHKKRAADAALDQAGAEYRASVLTAFQNVADALRTLEADSAALGAARRARQAAEESFAIVRRQLELGSVSYLSVVGAEQTLQQASIAEIAARTSALTDTATLYQALGGVITSG